MTAPLARRFPIARNPDRIADWQQRSQERARDRAAGAVRSAATRRTAIAPVSEKRARAIVAEAGKIAATRRPGHETGFSRAVKLVVRKRAGKGQVEDAQCECCGRWLGRYGGQIQHIVARGMGGTSNPVLSTAADAALLCGTPQSGDHGLAESRDPEMRRKGFWLPQGTDPRKVSMTLWSGIEVWRSGDGRYLYDAPEVSAA